MSHVTFFFNSNNRKNTFYTDTCSSHLQLFICIRKCQWSFLSYFYHCAQVHSHPVMTGTIKMKGLMFGATHIHFVLHGYSRQSILKLHVQNICHIRLFSLPRIIVWCIILRSKTTDIPLLVQAMTVIHLH